MSMGLIAFRDILLPRWTQSGLGRDGPARAAAGRYAHFRQDVPHDLPLVLCDVRQLGPCQPMVHVCSPKPDSIFSHAHGCSDRRDAQYFRV